MCFPDRLYGRKRMTVKREEEEGEDGDVEGDGEGQQGGEEEGGEARL
jgi:hypothetical protein